MSLSRVSQPLAANLTEALHSKDGYLNVAKVFHSLIATTLNKIVALKNNLRPLGERAPSIDGIFDVQADWLNRIHHSICERPSVRVGRRCR